MALFRSIRLRLTLWYIALLALILAAFGAGIYITLRHSLSTSLNDSLEVRSEEVLSSITFEGDLPTLAGAVPGTGPADGEQFVRVFDASGAITFDTGAPAEVSAEQDAIRAALNGATVMRGFIARDVTFRYRLVPIQRDGEVLGVLEVAHSEDDINDTLRTLLLIIGVSYPITILIASAGGLFLAGRALAPVDQLTRVARRISAEDLSQRLDLGLPDDEIGRLARTFDDMLARLDRSFRQQRQFTADASHELRTPLTAIKGQVDVALSKDRSADAYRRVLQSVNDETDRLIRLVSSLLTLARADTERLTLTVEPVDVAELVAGAVEHVQTLALERGLHLDLVPGPPAQLRADQDLLLQLLLNLLDNALKYTPPGGQVGIGWRVAGEVISLYVDDNGPGIPADALPRIFDRFYRVDKVRSRAEGGVGLGLSISRWIAEAHSGHLIAESATGTGAKFVVTLPMGPAVESPTHTLRAVL